MVEQGSRDALEPIFEVLIYATESIVSHCEGVP
jgi:hypothetical protein